jgi:hypothetical protein
VSKSAIATSASGTARLGAASARHVEMRVEPNFKCAFPLPLAGWPFIAFTAKQPGIVIFFAVFNRETKRPGE